jgi:two-component system chemotaxis response regulator CheY
LDGLKEFYKAAMSYHLENFRVLVIDDNMPIRMLIRMLLMDLGIGHVDMAVDGEDGLKAYHAQKPDIILVDWRMEKMDGIEFTRAIRAMDTVHAHHVPILVMTGYTNAEKVFEARDAGITEFLIKPFTVDALVKHIGHVIEHPRDYVDAPEFHGPDRRRQEKEVPPQAKKRDEDHAKVTVRPSNDFMDLRGGIAAAKKDA